jgi:membrane protein YqaA with SNARE-associated domain
MNLFSKIYHKVIELAKHRHAAFYLAGLSACEAVFFPIPPDVMLAPMVLSKPENAWRYAGVTTLSSVVGGLLGYLVGMFLFSLIDGWLQYMGYEANYLKIQQWFIAWGFWAVFVAGFTPIPYKLFTIAAGASAMSLPIFIIGSIVGRGSRFYLVSGVMRWGGCAMERVLLRYIEWLGWLVVGVFTIYLLYAYLT